MMFGFPKIKKTYPVTKDCPKKVAFKTSILSALTRPLATTACGA
jgi:hypothetical protein